MVDEYGIACGHSLNLNVIYISQFVLPGFNFTELVILNELGEYPPVALELSDYLLVTWIRFSRVGTLPVVKKTIALELKKRAIVSRLHPRAWQLRSDFELNRNPFLAAKLRERRLTTADLQLVQRRREFPTRFTQRLQLVVQNRVITPVLSGGGSALKVPLAVRLFERFPVLRRLPARLIGLGIRPEHVRTPEYAVRR